MQATVGFTTAYATTQTVFTIDSAPFVTYRYVGTENDAHAMAECFKHSSNLRHHMCFPDTTVTVQDGYKANSLWRALVAVSISDNHTIAYYLAR